MSIYPEHATERDRWILARRAARNQLDPFKPHAFLVEEERAESGEIVSVATIFLTNRECPWRCVMCDLWKNTLAETVPPGAIPAQIDFALAELSKQRSAGFQPASSGDIRVAGSNLEQRLSPDAQAKMPALRQIKLYNSGSFFDPRAVPPEEHEAIAQRVAAFDRVIVECHPALIGESALKFRDLLNATEACAANPPPAPKMSLRKHSPSPRPSPRGEGEPDATDSPGSGRRGPLRCMDASGGGHGHAATTKLEVAMGLETAHPQVLEKLNKRMTLDQFRRAAEFLRENGIALRVFILVKPPFLDEAEALLWARRSIDFAFDCGATVGSLIPTRFGNGALETLAVNGEFSLPNLATLEAALDYGVRLQRGRVFADLWDLEKFSGCAECFERRRARLCKMNLEQVILPEVDCGRCREG